VNEVSGERRDTGVPFAEIVPAHDLRRRQGYIAVQTARGCPFRCPYCAVGLICGQGHGSPAEYLPRSPAQVVAEISWWKVVPFVKTTK